MEPNLTTQLNSSYPQLNLAYHNTTQPQLSKLKPSLDTSSLTILTISNTDPRPDQKYHGDCKGSLKLIAAVIMLFSSKCIL